MSLGIVFKGPEGIVLAADSRVTLNAVLVLPGQQQPTMLPATFDNATKVLAVNGHGYAGVVTYGLGALGLREPRTAASFLPELEEELGSQHRLSVEKFAEKVSDFFMRQWTALSMPMPYEGPPMVFLVGGFDEDQPYGCVYQVAIPNDPTPVELNPGQFGVTWGGQREYADRIVQGFDDAIMPTIQQALGLTDAQRDDLRNRVKAAHSMKVPYQFLSLQDCVDLAIFLVRTTIQAQRWVVDIRGVGGAIDVATITRTKGFSFVQVKEMQGEIR